jgi:predicted nucleic acid-binding protein
LTLIIDSFAWIEFLTGGQRGTLVRHHLESGERLVTPDLVLAEVARKFGREGEPGRIVEGHLRAIVALSDVVSITTQVALRTTTADSDLREHARRHKLSSPSFADVVILAFAREFVGRVLTADRHFEGLPDVEWVGN